MRKPSVTWAYMLLVAAFLGCAAFQVPYEGPRHPSLEVVRVPTQPLLGLVPQGLPRLDLPKVRSSVLRMPPVRLMRQAGNSVRATGGQVLEWVVWGGRDPLMLFSSAEIWVCAGLDPRQERELAAIADRVARYRARLAEEGWTLVVVPVPAKLGIHRDLATWPVREAGLVTRTESPNDRSDEVHGYFVTALRARGVAAVDLLSFYRAEIAGRPTALLYPSGDTHWSGEGLRIAAEATVKEIARLTTLRARELKSPSHEEIEFVPDLVLAFDLLPGFPARLAPIHRARERVITREAGRPYQPPVKPEGLVMTLGTSYSYYYGGYTANPAAFPWQLGLRLQDAEVRQEAWSGSLGAFQSFWRQREQLSANFVSRAGAMAPKVVVWEFPIANVRAVNAMPDP
jgi:hypothetical protein